MARRAGARARSWRLCVGLCVLASAAIALGVIAGVALGSVLPDGRGWELVSAADKNGGDVIVDPRFVWVADDGSAVGYASLSEFGDSVGGGIATDYASVRSPAVGGQGWVTHGIIPPQTALTLSAAANHFEPRYEQDFSPDLSRGVLLAWRPLTSDPLVANVANLYLRDDVLAPGAGHYELVTACPLCIGPISVNQLLWEPLMVASTPDLSRVLFETVINLAPGAAGSGRKLYEWDAATHSLQLAGVLPDGSGAPDAAAGIGHGRFEHRHAISADGRKVFFMAAVGGVQNVYMRLDERTTVQLNVPLAGVSSSPQPAQYGDASVDGSRVFFTTTQQLTSDAPPSGGVYMYDTTLPASDPDHLVFVAAGNKAVGASADGHTVYLTATSALIPGQPPLPGTAGMYLWHDGHLAFVANLADEDILRLTENPVVDKTARVSPSGSLTFFSDLATATDPAGSCPETGTRACNMLYLATPASPIARCVSCHPDGTPPSTDLVTSFEVGMGGASLTGHLYRYLTDDGQRVFFTTAEALMPEDINGKDDAYEYDVATGTLHLISSGRDTANSYFMETDPGGSDALFATRQQLVGWDPDTNYDIYDARIGGGLPEPTPPPPGCTGQDCRPTPTAPPPTAPTTSQNAHTTGNLTQHLKPRTKPCHHGQTRKRIHHKTRCVKRKGRTRGTARRARHRR